MVRLGGEAGKPIATSHLGGDVVSRSLSDPRRLAYCCFRHFLDSPTSGTRAMVRLVGEQRS
ncbi:hypothetical protein MTR_2g091195 [Medicago truncatula]|uniref:Uncharacterized protein n=1 Tax=Medicago truncatula TaxID=3880 RepID=A0A072VB69_MEDTR|nr:hypothetical protein MTR_2g091195 [Medicago truncatula]